MSTSLSLVISFYNKVNYLELILAALERQSFKDFEVVIADDGSKKEIVERINLIISESPLNIQHIWHEDLGFRKTIILNEAIRRSKSDYLVFIDGDCIPHHRFIEEHYRNRQVHVLLAGRRVNLSDKISKTLTVAKIKSGYLSGFFLFRLIVDNIMGNSSHVMKGIYFGNRVIQKFLNRTVRGVLGCNFSIHKEDLLNINGFDERYLAPAVGEDTDIEVRLLWNNVRVKMIKNMAVQYHIDHPKLSRESDNLKIFEEVKRNRTIFTPFGLSKAEKRNPGNG